MAQVFQRIDPLPSKPLNYPQAVKTCSNENLVDLVKKVLKTDMNLDFLLELNLTWHSQNQKVEIFKKR